MSKRKENFSNFKRRILLHANLEFLCDIHRGFVTFYNGSFTHLNPTVAYTCTDAEAVR